MSVTDNVILQCSPFWETRTQFLLSVVWLSHLIACNRNLSRANCPAGKELGGNKRSPHLPPQIKAVVSGKTSYSGAMLKKQNQKSSTKIWMSIDQWFPKLGLIPRVQILEAHRNTVQTTASGFLFFVFVFWSNYPAMPRFGPANIELVFKRWRTCLSLCGGSVCTVMCLPTKSVA